MKKKSVQGPLWRINPWLCAVKKKNQKMAGSEQNIENLAFLLLPIPIKGNVSIVFVFFFVLEHWFKLCY